MPESSYSVNAPFLSSDNLVDGEQFIYQLIREGVDDETIGRILPSTTSDPRDYTYGHDD